MIRMLPLLACAIAVIVCACDHTDPSAEAELQQQKTEYEERKAKRLAQLEAEQQLMSAPSAAIVELTRRLEQPDRQARAHTRKIVFRTLQGLRAGHRKRFLDLTRDR